MATQKELRETMFDAGAAAAKVLLKHFGRIDSFQQKGEIDLVTVADKKAEDAIVKRIRKAFPDHAILGEESGASGDKDAEYLWVIDPLDGTTNFAHGNPIFCIAIGLQHRGETVMGLVVDPTRDEWFFARKGHGATLNGKRIHVSDKKKLKDSLVITGFPHDRRKNVRHFLDIVEEFLMETHGVLRLGAAAIDLSWVACGRAEAFWEEHLQPWDICAASLIIEEAGGRVSNIKGRKFNIFQNEILGSNGAIHRAMVRTIQKRWQPW